MRERPLLLLSVLCATVIACGNKSSSDQGPSTATPPTTTTAAPTTAPAGGGDPAAKAKEIFTTRCVPCHGAEGRGDGVASKTLTPPPRNFGDPAWQSSVTDEHIEKIIKFGGAAVGKSPAMPGNPDLTDAAVITALRAYVRGLGGK